MMQSFQEIENCGEEEATNIFQVISMQEKDQR